MSYTDFFVGLSADEIANLCTDSWRQELCGMTTREAIDLGRRILNTQVKSLERMEVEPTLSLDSDWLIDVTNLCYAANYVSLHFAMRQTQFEQDHVEQVES